MRQVQKGEKPASSLLIESAVPSQTWIRLGRFLSCRIRGFSGNSVKWDLCLKALLDHRPTQFQLFSGRLQINGSALQRGRDSKSAMPSDWNMLCVSDFARVAAWQDFIHVAFVIDAFARRVA
jgi:hypothetical protein